jgi:hypothetical protein
MDSPVRNVMLVERVTMAIAPQSPVWPTTQPNRRYMITPKMVRMEGVKTPPKVPSPVLLVLGSAAVLAEDGGGITGGGQGGSWHPIMPESPVRS